MKGDNYVVIAYVELTEKLILSINYVTSIMRCFIAICPMNKFNNTIQENDNDDDHDDYDDYDDDCYDDYAFTDNTLATRGVKYVWSRFPLCLYQCVRVYFPPLPEFVYRFDQNYGFLVQGVICSAC